MRTLSINLTAGQRKNIYAAGNLFFLMATTAEINVEFIKNGAVVETAEAVEYGLKARPDEGFTELGFYSATTQTIKIYVGRGDGSYDRLTGIVTISNVNGAYAHTQKSVTNASQSLLAANTARRAAIIQNNDAAAVLRVRFDGVAPTATTGLRIQAGQVYEVPELAPTGEIFGMMETATGTANNVEVITA